MRRIESASGTDMEISGTRIPSVQRADPDVADRERAGVIALDSDEAARREPIVRVLGKLARSDALLPVLAPEVVLDHLHAVQPVLDMIASHHEACPVPLIERFGDARGHPVEGVIRPGGREWALAILGVGVIEQLILRRTPVDMDVLARAAVEDAAVAGFADFPLELELEVAIAPRRDEIIDRPVLRQHPARDVPAGRKARLLPAAPPGSAVILKHPLPDASACDRIGRRYRT